MSGGCNPTRLALGAYALGTLEPGDQDEVEAHLASCTACLTELADLESVVPRLASLSAADLAPPVPSPDLFTRITQAVDSADRDADRDADPTTARTAAHSTGRRRVPTRWLFAAAACVLVLIGIGTAAGIARSSSPSAPGTTTASATAGGVQLQVAATDATSGTRLELTAAGLPRHEHCHLVAVAADGSRHDAGSWDAGYEGTARVSEHTEVSRSQLRRLTLYGDDGRTLVTVEL